MAIENIIPKPSNSSYQDVSIVARASRMVLALDWKEPVYINTLLVICIAFLIQSALKSRKRMRRLEEEVRDVVEKWNDMERQIDELREEMRISREEDREEKLCLVENVKQVMRQRTLSPDRGSESNDIHVTKLFCHFKKYRLNISHRVLSTRNPCKRAAIYQTQ